MATYPYAPLDLAGQSIRLLHIQKGWSTDDIICQLIESYCGPEEGVPYKALSYNWGGLQHKPRGSSPRVLVDGHQIGITENLYSALRQIRCPYEDVILWVDAICINQEDPREKGHQVKQMGHVYKGAEEVLIWLGPSNADIDFLLESISLIDKKATEAQAIANKKDWMSLCRHFMSPWSLDLHAETPQGPKKAVAELLARPWFNRVWILQEVALARTARIICGSKSCPARAFALMPSVMNMNVDKHTQAVLDIMPRFRKNTWWSSNRHLHFLLTKFAESQAFLARDKIYALLGMSEDACHSQTFYPCYEKSDDKVFRDTASFILFGEILGPDYSLPEFRLLDLRLPIARLAERTLSLALEQQDYPQYRQSARKTAELLVRRMNEGQLETTDVLLAFAERHGKVDRVQEFLASGNKEVWVQFSSFDDDWYTFVNDWYVFDDGLYAYNGDAGTHGPDFIATERAPMPLVFTVISSKVGMAMPIGRRAEIRYSRTRPLIGG